MDNNILPGDYIAGFVDGEGCFALKFRRDVKKNRIGQPAYFSWDVEFAVVLRSDDLEILKQIQKTLGCGKIYICGRSQARYCVDSVFDLFGKIVPFFEKYPLRAKKKKDFELWREAVIMFERKSQNKTTKSFSTNDLLRLNDIHQEMRGIKSQGNEWKWIKEAKAML